MNETKYELYHYGVKGMKWGGVGKMLVSSPVFMAKAEQAERTIAEIKRIEDIPDVTTGGRYNTRT